MTDRKHCDDIDEKFKKLGERKQEKGRGRRRGLGVREREIPFVFMSYPVLF